VHVRPNDPNDEDDANNTADSDDDYHEAGSKPPIATSEGVGPNEVNHRSLNTTANNGTYQEVDRRSLITGADDNIHPEVDHRSPINIQYNSADHEADNMSRIIISGNGTSLEADDASQITTLLFDKSFNIYIYIYHSFRSTSKEAGSTKWHGRLYDGQYRIF
jgi:hypothetical protein